MVDVRYLDVDVVDIDVLELFAQLSHGVNWNTEGEVLMLENGRSDGEGAKELGG
jgi:hypothetical protein